MIRKLVSLLSNQFKHPLLMGLFLIAVVFLGLGVGAELTARPTTAGLFGVYAVLATVLGATGYAIIYTGQLILLIEQQYWQTGS